MQSELVVKPANGLSASRNPRIASARKPASKCSICWNLVGLIIVLAMLLAIQSGVSPLTLFGRIVTGVMNRRNQNVEAEFYAKLLRMQREQSKLKGEKPPVACNEEQRCNFTTVFDERPVYRTIDRVSGLTREQFLKVRSDADSLHARNQGHR